MLGRYLTLVSTCRTSIDCPCASRSTTSHKLWSNRLTVVRWRGPGMTLPLPGLAAGQACSFEPGFFGPCLALLCRSGVCHHCSEAELFDSGAGTFHGEQFWRNVQEMCMVKIIGQNFMWRYLSSAQRLWRSNAAARSVLYDVYDTAGACGWAVRFGWSCCVHVSAGSLRTRSSKEVNRL